MLDRSFDVQLRFKANLLRSHSVARRSDTHQTSALNEPQAASPVTASPVTARLSVSAHRLAENVLSRESETRWKWEVSLGAGN